MRLKRSKYAALGDVFCAFAVCPFDYRGHKYRMVGVRLVGRTWELEGADPQRNIVTGKEGHDCWQWFGSMLGRTFRTTVTECFSTGYLTTLTQSSKSKATSTLFSQISDILRFCISHVPPRLAPGFRASKSRNSVQWPPPLAF